ncbi:MAG: DUF4832 domain-containing protein [Bacteroidales bacterium]
MKLDEYSHAFRNPMKGLREFFSPGIDKIREEYPYPYGSLIKEYMQWNMIEDKATDCVDKILDYSNKRWKGVQDINMKVIPRVYLIWVEPWHGGKSKNVNNPNDMKGYHWPSDMPGEISPYKQIKGSTGAYVDSIDKFTPITGGYFDPAFPERVEKLVEKLGKAWDNDPRVAYVEMGIIGEWGEQHDPDLSTYWAPHDEPKHVLNRTWIPGMEKVLGDAFSKAFKYKKVMVRYAYEFKDYKFGIYWDSWSQPQEIDRGYEEMIKRGDYWKTQPIGGEITWNWGDLAKFKRFENVVADPYFRNYTIGQIRNLHCNHLGGITWANYNDSSFKCNAELLQKSLGYRFVISEFSYSKNINSRNEFDISFKVSNTGSSPFYYNWPIEISLLNADTHKKVWGTILKDINISNWLPGENWDAISNKYRIPAPIYVVNKKLMLNLKLSDCKYIVAISVLDPAGMLPSLRFANKNYFTGGYHPIGYIGLGLQINDYVISDNEFDDIQNDKTLKYKLNNQ